MLSQIGISYGRLGNVKAAVFFLVKAIYYNSEDIESFHFFEYTIEQSFNFLDFYSAYFIKFTNS